MTLRLRAFTLALMLSSALAGCDKAPAPNTTSADLVQPTQPPVMAPTAMTLPPAPPAPVSRSRTGRDRYDYVNRASAYNDSFSDRAPDYAVDYQGQQPWVWQAADGAYRVVENTPSGERYYYYQSGQDQPFLVRDSEYSYGYGNGQLVVVYDAEGRPLPYDVAHRQADLAGRYLARARDLYAAAQQTNRQAAYQANWAARQAEMNRQRTAWTRQQQSNPDWRAWAATNRAPSQPPVAAYAAPGPTPYAGPGSSSPPRFGQAAGPPPSSPPVPVGQAPQALKDRQIEDARSQQARADAARQAQSRTDAEAARQANMLRTQQAEQAQQEGARAAEQARQAQAIAQAQQAAQTRQIDNARLQQARSDAARQAQLAAQAAQARQTATQESWQARHDAKAQARASQQAPTQAPVAQAAPPRPKRDHGDAAEARNTVTPQR